VGEHSSEFTSAHRAYALGTVASPARLPDPVSRVTPDAEHTVQDSREECNVTIGTIRKFGRLTVWGGGAKPRNFRIAGNTPRTLTLHFGSDLRLFHNRSETELESLLLPCCAIAFGMIASR